MHATKHIHVAAAAAAVVEVVRLITLVFVLPYGGSAFDVVLSKGMVF